MDEKLFKPTLKSKYNINNWINLLIDSLKTIGSINEIRYLEFHIPLQHDLFVNPKNIYRAAKEIHMKQN